MHGGHRLGDEDPTGPADADGVNVSAVLAGSEPITFSLMENLARARTVYCLPVDAQPGPGLARWRTS